MEGGGGHSGADSEKLCNEYVDDKKVLWLNPFQLKKNAICNLVCSYFGSYELD